MPTTRSATKQSHKEDFVEGKEQGTSLPGTRGQANSLQAARARKVKSKESSSESSKVPTKRHASPENAAAHPSSKRKTSNKDGGPTHAATSSTTKPDYSIPINRAPVLQLWVAVVASFIYPELSWPTCLSIGNAISSLCAISKGRSIGLIEPASDDRHKKRERKPSNELRTLHIMGFCLQLKGNTAIVSGKPKTLNEDNLRRKFGNECYNAVKKAFAEALDSWKDDRDELDKNAFHMYEQFRPNVAGGQKGWGRRGELDMQEVMHIVRR